MAFRADMAAEKGFSEAISDMVNRLPHELREESENQLRDIVLDCGPVIDTYPSWHPLVAHLQKDKASGSWPETGISRGMSHAFPGMDHNVFFVHGFLSCPYGSGGERLVESVEQVSANSPIQLKATILNSKFYQTHAQPVLVKVLWPELEKDRTISKRLAVGSMLEQSLNGWRHTEVGETWDTMKYYLLESPHGSRSSLFVNQETGQAMKNVWNAMLKARVFGPVFE